MEKTQMHKITSKRLKSEGQDIPLEANLTDLLHTNVFCHNIASTCLSMQFTPFMSLFLVFCQCTSVKCANLVAAQARIKYHGIQPSKTAEHLLQTQSPRGVMSSFIVNQTFWIYWIIKITDKYESERYPGKFIVKINIVNNSLRVTG